MNISEMLHEKYGKQNYQYFLQCVNVLSAGYGNMKQKIFFLQFVKISDRQVYYFFLKPFMYTT